MVEMSLCEKSCGRGDTRARRLALVTSGTFLSRRKHTLPWKRPIGARMHAIHFIYEFIRWTNV